MATATTHQEQRLQLEVLSCLPRGERRAAPLLFVHGAFWAAWCWAEHFLPYFADNGYAAHAVSLRGHGASDGHERLRWTSLGEYVADVERAVAALDATPVMIGHSMGGMIVQKYLERASAPAAVLMASVPPEGLLSSSLWLALRDPLLFQDISLIALSGSYFATPQAARRAVFSPDMPDGQVERYYSRMQQESQRVVIDMSGYDLPQRNVDGRPPVLVLGAERDALLPPFLVESTARAFDTEAELFPNMAHAMMLDARWRQVADRILAWLDELRL